MERSRGIVFIREVSIGMIRSFWSLGIRLCVFGSLAFISAEAVESDNLMRQMHKMRPPNLMVLEKYSKFDGEYLLGIYSVEREVNDPDLRRFKLWQEFPDRFTSHSESVRCNTQQPIRLKRERGAIYLRRLNPGGELNAFNRNDHLVWWAVCHPNIFDNDLSSLTEKALKLGYSTLLRESQEVLFD